LAHYSQNRVKLLASASSARLWQTNYPVYGYMSKGFIIPIFWLKSL
jgi:hypothetical protein